MDNVQEVYHFSNSKYLFLFCYIIIQKKPLLCLLCLLVNKYFSLSKVFDVITVNPERTRVRKD
jgi:hypothetical protein